MKNLIPCLVVALGSVAGAQSIVNQFPTGGLFAGGLEYSSNTVWVADQNSDRIYEFDGNGTPIKNYAAPNTLVIGVGFDPNTGMLWVGDEAEIMYEIDPATGVPTGKTFSTVPSITDLSGVALDPVSGHIFVSQDSAPQKIAEFDQNGATIVIISLAAAGSTDPDGLGYNPSTDTFFTGEDLTDRILEVDRTGAKIGEWSTAPLGISPEGIAIDVIAGTVFVAGGFSNIVYELSGIIQPGFTIFCTAKTGLVCGTPSISASGVPSATQSSGFVVSAGPARDNRSGLLMYNDQGTGPGLPFNGGLLCVNPMGIRRAGSTNSMGSCPPTPIGCAGVFSIDMNAFAQAMWVVPDCAGNPAGIPPNNPAAFLLTIGATVDCQFWGRDSVATGSLVSDGLTWTVGP